ncbi:Uncharacterized conserved protein YeaO, DUF488 family [Izhakiella capsodis]|uniref:Uncharacterized conserved protein YeaO, DUF488 family n=1 Tax=Izhakiella capsodis TaxID=1367852 RepID=A0A1I4VAD7_9GAMM|nr:DUF488 family protein [Izhakiella capsodis]SFM98151.1 Uncharacterized conserved protein YeaO, DUF488 family [Izhakiella capsodis]
MFQCKRVYQIVEKSDGYRVLIDRLWPRGIKKVDLVLDGWLKNLAPSADLRLALHRQLIDFSSFSVAYRQELYALDRSCWLPLVATAEKGTVTLLYASSDTQHNHALVLKKFLETQPLWPLS